MNSTANTFQQDYDKLVKAFETKQKNAKGLARQAIRKYPQSRQTLNLAAVIFASCPDKQDKEAGIKIWLKIKKEEREEQINTNIGRVYGELNQHQKAVEFLQEAIRIQPDYLPAYRQLGESYMKLEQYDEARDIMHTIIQRQPDSIENSQLFFKLGVTFFRQNQTQQAVDYYRQALDIDPLQYGALSNLLFSLQYLPEQDYAAFVEETLQRAGEFSRKINEVLQLSPAAVPSEINKVLRIGLISGDLNQHPVGLFIEGLLFESLNQPVQWFAYSNSEMDELSHHIRPLFQQWHSIQDLSTEDICQKIRSDGIDVLIDLSGYTNKGKMDVLAAQVAPVQISWLGYFATTGLPTVQAIIADPYCVPSEEESFYCERVYKMPHTRLCIVPPERNTISIPNTLPALDNGYITFGCFQNINKLNDSVLQTWATISQKVPNAHWHFQLTNTTDENLQKIKQKMQALNWQGEVHFESKKMRGEYIDTYQKIDLVLDTFPFPGGTTTAEALWMGVPTLTLTQAGMVRRQGEQILSAANATQWITHSQEEYIEQACYWSDPSHFEALNQFRITFRQNARNLPLYNFKQFAADWHKLIRQIWQDACEKHGQTIQTASEHTLVPIERNAQEMEKLVNAHPQYLAAYSMWLHKQHEDALNEVNNLLTQFPTSETLLNFKAAILAQTGNTAGAIETWETIPNYTQNADILGNLGVAYQRSKNWTKSQHLLEKALKLSPKNSNVLMNLGISLEQLLKMDKALECYQKACRVDPNNQEAQNNLKRFNEKLEKNDHPWMPAYVDIVRERYQNREEALKAIEDLCEKYPNTRKLDILRADLLADDLQFEASLAVYENIADKDAQILARMGIIHRFNKKNDPDAEKKARTYFDESLKLDASNQTALLHLAYQAQEADDFETAKQRLEELLAIDATDQSALIAMGGIYANRGDYQRALDYYHRLLDINPDHLVAQGLAAFFRNYIMPHEPEKRAEEVKKVGRLYAKFNTIQPAPRPQNPEKPLRIGLVSADLNDHVVGFFIESLLSGRAIHQYQWVAYANSTSVTGLTHRIQPLFEKWHTINQWDTQKVVEQVREDEVDILIDLSGYTAGNRLDVFSTQAAPLQLTWLGYFASTGIPAIQGIIADPYCVPQGEENLYSEKVYRLPHTRLCMTAPGKSGRGKLVQGKMTGEINATITVDRSKKYDIDVQPNPSLQNGYIRFGCYQNLAKINEEVLKTWAKIAQQLPQARFHFQTSRLAAESADRKRFEQSLKDLGFNMAHVSIEGNIAREQYLAGYNDVDIVLDTFPYNGGTTTAEALWMGKPTISLALAGMISRQGEQMLSAAGYGHWVCRTREEYIAKAVECGNPANFARLNEEHMQMREKVLQSPLFNTEQFATDWCNLIREIWRDACQNATSTL